MKLIRGMGVSLDLLSPHTYNFPHFDFLYHSDMFIKIQCSFIDTYFPSSEFTLESTLNAGDLDKYIEMQIMTALYLLNVLSQDNHHHRIIHFFFYFELSCPFLELKGTVY